MWKTGFIFGLKRRRIIRIELDEKFLEEHPEKKEMLKRHIEKQKEYIIQCVLENSGNPLLAEITMM